MNIQVPVEHYFKKSYDTKARFISYWHQIDEIVQINPTTILEIGIGNGFVSDYLKKRSYYIKTIDIDERLNPDYIGNVLNLPFDDSSFQVVSCCEVLEHIPYENFKTALSEIYRVTNNYAIISIPDVTRAYRLDIQIPKIGEITKLIVLPKRKKIIHKFDGEHYWEIGKKNYPLNKIINDINLSGFTVLKTYRIFEFTYHRFFILKK
jgi:SAM-dependent methyltransferase